MHRFTFLSIAALNAALIGGFAVRAQVAPLPLAHPELVLPKPVVASAAIQTSSSTATKPVSAIHSFTLENGLRVVVLSEPGAPAVTHMLWFRVGAVQDDAGKSGLAHYVEHIMFQGTDAHGPGTYSSAVMRMGGDQNAFTTPDFTAYHATLAKEHLPALMALEADRMQHLNPPQTAFAKEREVIIEERRMRVENDPGARLREEVDAALFLNHPYRRPVIGWHDEMARLTREDVVAFQKAWYAPNNATLILGGNITEAESRRLAEQYYGPIPKRDLPAAITWEEPKARADQRLIFRDVQAREAVYQRAWITPSSTDGVQKLLPYVVLSGVLGEGNRSRLFRTLVMDKHLATEAGSSLNALTLGPGRLSLWVVPSDRAANVNPAAQSLIEASVEGVLKNLAAKPPGAEEMKRVKTQLKSVAVYGMDGTEGATSLLGQLVMLGLPPDYLKQWPADIEAVTAEQVRDAAAEVLASRRLEAWMLPTGTATDAPKVPLSAAPLVAATKEMH